MAPFKEEVLEHISAEFNPIYEELAAAQERIVELDNKLAIANRDCAVAEQALEDRSSTIWTLVGKLAAANARIAEL